MATGAATNNTALLACDLVKDHFGETVETVFKTLTFRGNQTVRHLERTTGLDYQLIRQSLLTLITHNIVEYKESKKDAVYEAIPSHARMLLRFPRFLSLTRARYGPEGERLLQGLLVNGQTTQDQLIEIAVKSKDVGAEVKEHLRKTFAVLVSDGLIMPHVVTAETREKKKLDENAPLMKIKKRKRTGSDDEGDPPAKRLAAGLMTERGVIANGAEDPAGNVQWKVNYKQFTVAFRHMDCAEYVTQILGPLAGMIVGALLRLVEPDTTELTSFSDAVTTQQLLTAVSAETAVTYERFAEAVRELTMHQPPLLDRTRVFEGDGYRCNVGYIVAQTRTKMVESIIEAKFGPEASRIFRLLLTKEKMDQRQVGSLAMLPKKECNEKLYQLLLADYCTLTEVPKTADYAAATTFFLWSVEMERVCRRLCEQMTKASRNLILRRKMEVERKQQLLEAANEDIDVLTEEERATFDKLQAVVDQLEMSLLRLDESIAKLQD